MRKLILLLFGVLFFQSTTFAGSKYSCKSMKAGILEVYEKNKRMKIVHPFNTGGNRPIPLEKVYTVISDDYVFFNTKVKLLKESNYAKKGNGYRTPIKLCKNKSTKKTVALVYTKAYLSRKKKIN